MDVCNKEQSEPRVNERGTLLSEFYMSAARTFAALLPGSAAHCGAQDQASLDSSF